MKPCGMCLTEIPEAALRCPQCGGDPRGRIDWSGFIGTAGWLAAAILVCAIGFGTGSDAGKIVGAFAILGVIAMTISLIWDYRSLSRTTAAPPPTEE